MKRRRFWILFLIAVFFVATCAWAAMHENNKKGDHEEMHSQRQHQQMKSQEYVQANDLIGKKAVSKEKEDLGTITNVTIDPTKEQVSYVVLTKDEKEHFAIPWQAVQFEKGQQEVALNISQNQLDQAESFTDNWPNQASEELKQGMKQDQQQQQMQQRQQQMQQRQQQGQQDTELFDLETEGEGLFDVEYDQQKAQEQRQQKEEYGISEEQQQQKQQMAQQQQFNLKKATDLIGINVETAQEEQLANVEDLVMSQQQGKVEYVVISIMEDQLALVPYQSLGFTAKPALTATIQADQQTLEQFAFEEGQMPDIDQQYAQQLQQEFGQRQTGQVLAFIPAQEEKQSVQAWLKDSQFNQNFDADNIQTMRVTVKSVGTFYPEDNATPGLRLKVEDQQGQMHIVFAGPKDYVDQQDISIVNNDELMIKGSQANINDQEVILAQHIKEDDKVLKLYDQQGQPAWSESELTQKQQQMRQQQQQQQMRQQQQQKQQEMEKEQEKTQDRMTY